MRTSLINLESKVGVIAPQLKATKARLGGKARSILNCPLRICGAQYSVTLPPDPQESHAEGVPCWLQVPWADSLEKSLSVVPGAKLGVV